MYPNPLLKKAAGTPEGERRVSGSKAFQGLVDWFSQPALVMSFWILKVGQQTMGHPPTTRMLVCLCCRELRYEHGRSRLANKWTKFSNIRWFENMIQLRKDVPLKSQSLLRPLLQRFGGNLNEETSRVRFKSQVQGQERRLEVLFNPH